jgi:F0F1-type ATP synthase assembly protein I
MTAPEEPRDGVRGWLDSVRGGASQFGSMGHVGMMFPVSIAFGMLIGRWLDNRLGTSPWLMLLGFALGVATAMRELLRAVAKLDDEPDDDNESRWKQ